jgi:mono/diheme cytochrome c family protein
MSARLIIAGAALVAAALSLVFAYGTNMGREDSMAIDAADIAQGQMLYADNCAACHGANLEGQPDWQSNGPDGKLPAPPNDASGHTWHHSDQVLFDYTKLGGKQALADQGVVFDSGMPGFGEQLSDQEIRNTLAFIKSKWPEREKQAQATRSQAATE